MDRLIYVAMTGAQQLLEKQAVAAHNLANTSTAGYKADISAFRAVPMYGPGQPTRTYALETTPGADFTPGTVTATGRDLDVAVNGKGFLAVQTTTGTEAYTRAGGLRVSPDGELQTSSGLTVLGDGGPISIPENTRVAIGTDGTVSAVDLSSPGANVTTLGKLKLVNPDPAQLQKGGDGLFRMKNGASADGDDTVTVTSGAIESSNVNAVSAMVDMIDLARQFDMQMKALQNVDQNEQHANQLLASSG
jgi:flagellar basal-body rod protein FlgF